MDKQDIADVNHELNRMKAMVNFAVDNLDDISKRHDVRCKLVCTHELLVTLIDILTTKEQTNG